MSKKDIDNLKIRFCTFVRSNEASFPRSEFNNLAKFIMTLLPREYQSEEPSWSSKLCGEDTIFIAFTRMRDLHAESTYNDFSTKVIGEDVGECLRGKRTSPIILIGLEDFTGRLDDEKKNIQIKILDQLNLDPRVKFFDSSIWIRYVPLGEKFPTTFQNVFEEILDNSQKNLYKTNVAREFFEFKIRMMINSRLGLPRGHSGDVTPYKFHSELLMKERADTELGKITELKIEIKGKVERLKWRVLIIDDFGDKGLMIEGDPLGPTKREIVSIFLDDSLVEEIEVCSAKEGEIEGEKREESLIVGARFALKQKMYDLILLDYLLGDRKVKASGESSTTVGREYGNELLKLIEREIDDLRKFKGPLNRFWIFPISAFSYAMLDELREQGIPHFGEHWHLSSGADPVCTPHLFAYKLYRFMNRQIKEVNPHLNQTLKEKFGMPPDRDKHYVSKQAKTFYPTFVKFHGSYRSLNEDRSGTGKSMFAETMLRLLEEKTPQALWEHFHNLIYLLAYGSGIEWPEMWEEYSFINYKLQTHGRDASAEVQVPLQNIRDYIISLQKQFK